MEVKYLVLCIIAGAIFLFVMTFVEANHFSVCSPNCNVTVVWWNDTLNVTSVSNVDGTATVRVDGKTFCSVSITNGQGWSCAFQAPMRIGTYNLSVAYSGGTSDDVLLVVRPTFGKENTGSASRFVSENLWAMQEPSGDITNVISRLTVSKGIPL
jgi:hypothetical protein